MSQGRLGASHHGTETLAEVDAVAPRVCVERATLSALVEEGLSIRQIAERLDRSPTSVRHWLRRYGLKTDGRRGRRPVNEAERDGPQDARATCPHHGLTLHRWFDDRGYRCLRCRSMYVANRRREIKATLVEEAGGCCAVCGYSRCLRALSFHHVDPTTKAFGIALYGSARSLARAREEARKCVLLCSNCHAEVEAGVTSV
ncbi:MAG: helix-turn-helix domain-containing protein [Thermoleophilaceae bacterium]|nr:helix-turn-helix domain-containing protein [Thermoleophilaceae bacterium]